MLDPIAAPQVEFTLHVERLYAALMRSAKSDSAAEPGLGGKLLYAGELDGQGRALLVAGNIAGAASLAATADAAAGKQSQRDGVADFLVTSLDEALRILKNEIRKRETVAVCIAATPEPIEREMLERGVQPDLLGPLSLAGAPSQLYSGQSARQIELLQADTARVPVTWKVASAPAQWLPKLDAIALACLEGMDGLESSAARRWIRLAPRYLGRLAREIRVLQCRPEVAKEFAARVQSAVERGEIGAEVRIGVNTDEQVLLFHPSQAPLS